MSTERDHQVTKDVVGKSIYTHMHELIAADNISLAYIS